MRRILGALVGGCAIGLALFTTLAVAFALDIWPISAILDNDTHYGF